MRILFNQTQLQQAVEKVAREIHSRHYNDPNPPVMICVLNGAFMFFTDLVRQINIDCEIDFMRVKSYQGQNQFEITMTKDIETDITGRTVYIVDDIIDSGNTMISIGKHLKSQPNTPKDIVFVSLFKKYTSDLDCIYGIELTDETWICGYGLDGENGLHRNKNSIFGFIQEID
jgi:hypoxanthine phosphoribosyltransferase